MLTIHISCLPKPIQKFLSKSYKDGWIHGKIFVDEFSTTCYFMDKNDKVLFEFSRPIVIFHTEQILCYLATVFTEYKKGEMCRLIFHFNNPNPSSTPKPKN